MIRSPFVMPVLHEKCPLSMARSEHLLQVTQHTFLYDPQHASQVRTLPDPDYIFAMHSIPKKAIVGGRPTNRNKEKGNRNMMSCRKY